MSTEPLTILVTAVGSPGSAALLRALKENGERPVRLVGTDLREENVGRFHCDAFSTVPAGSDPAFGPTILELAKREGARVVLPQASFDLEGLAEMRADFEAAGIALICSSPDAVRAADSKHATLALCEQLGVRAPAFRLARGGAEVAAAARELGYPPAEVRDLADLILHGVFAGDLADALDRAGAFCRLAALGGVAEAGNVEGHSPEQAVRLTTQAARLSTMGRELTVCARMWRAGTLD